MSRTGPRRQLKGTLPSLEGEHLHSKSAPRGREQGRLMVLREGEGHPEGAEGRQACSKLSTETSAHKWAMSASVSWLSLPHPPSLGLFGRNAQRQEARARCQH